MKQGKPTRSNAYHCPEMFILIALNILLDVSKDFCMEIPCLHKCIFKNLLIFSRLLYIHFGRNLWLRRPLWKFWKNSWWGNFSVNLNVGQVLKLTEQKSWDRIIHLTDFLHIYIDYKKDVIFFNRYVLVSLTNKYSYFIEISIIINMNISELDTVQL